MITARLYGGDHDMRIRQEMVLGIGGYRALIALAKKPAVCHMNEGHSAFMALERARMQMVAHGVGYAEAREAAASGNLFTTHTPVDVGNEEHEHDRLNRLGLAASLNLTQAELETLGGVPFNMIDRPTTAGSAANVRFQKS